LCLVVHIGVCLHVDFVFAFSYYVLGSFGIRALVFLYIFVCMYSA